MDNKALFVMILVLLLAVALVQSFQLHMAKEKIKEKITGTTIALTEENLVQTEEIGNENIDIESEKAPDELEPGQKIKE